MQDKLDQDKADLPSLCPAGFPAVDAWASSESDAEIGMQLRAVAQGSSPWSLSTAQMSTMWQHCEHALLTPRPFGPWKYCRVALLTPFAG